MELIRKNYSPEQKVLILKKHLVEKVALSDICDQYGLHPSLFYRWQKAFFEGGAVIFQGPKESHDKQLKKQIAELELKLSGKNEVMAELLSELVTLKKKCGVI